MGAPWKRGMGKETQHPSVSPFPLSVTPSAHQKSPAIASQAPTAAALIPLPRSGLVQRVFIPPTCSPANSLGPPVWQDKNPRANANSGP